MKALNALLEKHAGSLMLVVIVISAIVLALSVVWAMQQPAYDWTATYCADSPCTAQSEMVHESGSASMNAACPETFRVSGTKMGAVRFGTRHFHLIPDTCVVTRVR